MWNRETGEAAQHFHSLNSLLSGRNELDWGGKGKRPSSSGPWKGVRRCARYRRISKKDRRDVHHQTSEGGGNGDKSKHTKTHLGQAKVEFVRQASLSLARRGEGPVLVSSVGGKCQRTEDTEGGGGRTKCWSQALRHFKVRKSRRGGKRGGKPSRTGNSVSGAGQGKILQKGGDKPGLTMSH